MTRCSILAVLVASVPVVITARGTTTRIIVSGPDLVAPIEIVEDVGRFHVWAGPGTSSNEAQSLIVDWATGAVEPPKSQPVYKVSLETTRRDPSTYVVFYTFDPSTKNGYVFIPGKAHPAYTNNTWLILHGVEGNWFRAWNEWEKLVQPLIGRASKNR
jgi:hypothetical protein